MKNIILFFCLFIVIVTGQDGKITCTVPPVEMFRDTVLTCHFPEDINVTKRDFAVYHNPTDNADAVVDCWWRRGNMTCSAKPGITFDGSVGRMFNITFHKVSSTVTGTYSCQVANYDAKSFTTCQLELIDDSVEDISTGLAIGLSLALITVITATILVVLLRRRNTSCILRRRNMRTSADGEDHLMIEKEDETTAMFQKCLVKSIEEMYPDTLESFYFVPPVYFNMVRYETQTIAGQHVYVPQLPDPSDLRHDRAMQHVLHCLHHMAEHNNEQMFVLSQFKYEDYLNNPGHNFTNHRLSVPAGLKGKKKVGCFDILIIHRHFGVFVGLVKSLSDKDDGSEDSERKIDEELVNEVREAVAQLKYAESMMNHLMSDQEQKPSLQMTLILPNVSLSSLQQAIGSHSQVLQSLRECIKVKANDDPTHLCLCANHLSKLCDVDDPVMSHLKNWWERFLNQSDAGAKMTDELYLNMIARFCGPATQSTLQVQDETFLQPKTLADATSLTGDLYERLTVYPYMIDLLSEERLFLVRPPNTGKTRMLTLAGKKWMESGHDLYILFGILAQWDVGSSFSKTSEHKPDTMNTDETSRPILTQVNCNFNVEKEMKDILDMLTSRGKKKSPLCVLASEVDIRGKHFKTFFETLKRQHPDLLLWATSSTSENVPDGWKVQTFTRALNCPPAVIREASRAGADYFLPGADIKPLDCLTPTDGPQVKYIYHEKDSTGSHDCSRCGRTVADFLKKHLVTKSNKRASADDTSKTTSSAITREQRESPTLKGSSSLQDKDILVVFENDKHEDSFLGELKKIGLKVQRLVGVNGKDEERKENDCVCAMHVDSCRKFRQRRKVVVYVESRSPPEDVSKKWWGITSCSSSLIIVRWKTT